jgi:mRNA-degrading endonuclease RelE of RelBE toxin-antitoxin system
LRFLTVLTRIVTRMGTDRYELVYARELKEHLRVIDRKHHSLIRKTIEEQLWFEPDIETKNRKPLRRGPMYDAEWEIRCGPDNQFRIFYEVDRDRRTVSILAIGIKKGHRLRIGGQEVSR